jgi:metal-sulfur cluster biosynthetic enzyme
VSLITPAFAVDILLPMLATAMLYVGSAALARRGLFQAASHRTAWNFVLLLLFVTCAVTGILLCFKSLFSDLSLAVRLHNQSGAGLVAAGIGHILERSRYFLAKISGTWRKFQEGTSHAPQVAAALVVMGAILAIPSVLVNLTADRASRPAAEIRKAARSAASQAMSQAAPQDTEAAVPTTSTEDLASAIPETAVRTSPSAKTTDSVAVRAPGEAARVLATNSGETPLGFILPRIANRSAVETRVIQDLLRGVVDPDVGMNLYDFGLVRRIDADSAGNVTLGIVLTTPACPNSGWIRERLRNQLATSGLFRSVSVQVLGNYWSPKFVTPEGRQASLERQKW